MGLYVLAESEQQFEHFLCDNGISLSSARWLRDPRDMRGASGIVLIPERFFVPPHILDELRCNPHISIVMVPEPPAERRRRLLYERDHVYVTREFAEDSPFSMRGRDFISSSAIALPPRVTPSAPPVPTSPPPAPACSCQPECLCKGIGNS
jgi:hypothetical protein